MMNISDIQSVMDKKKSLSGQSETNTLTLNMCDHFLQLSMQVS